MPARNLHHDAVVQALQSDGWKITHDPMLLSFGDRRLFVDLGAERLTIGAERDNERIAVEVTSFLADSPVRDLQEAVGQFVVYRAILNQVDPDRQLLLAVSTIAFDAVFSEPIGQLIVGQVPLRLLVFDVQTLRIVRWIP